MEREAKNLRNYDRNSYVTEFKHIHNISVVSKFHGDGKGSPKSLKRLLGDNIVKNFKKHNFTSS